MTDREIRKERREVKRKDTDRKRAERDERKRRREQAQAGGPKAMTTGREMGARDILRSPVTVGCPMCGVLWRVPGLSWNGRGDQVCEACRHEEREPEPGPSPLDGLPLFAGVR